MSRNYLTVSSSKLGMSAVENRRVEYHNSFSPGASPATKLGRTRFYAFTGVRRRGLNKGAVIQCPQIVKFNVVAPPSEMRCPEPLRHSEGPSPPAASLTQLSHQRALQGLLWHDNILIDACCALARRSISQAASSPRVRGQEPPIGRL